MANLQGFDSDQVEPNVGFVPLENGEYVSIIVKSEEKPNSKGTGSYLQLYLEVWDGPHKGRKFKDKLNLDNPNPTTVEIAKGSLSAICRAVGVPRPNDSEELHDKPLVAIVVKVPRNDKPGEFSNEVKGYKPVGGKAPAPVTGGSKPTPPKEPAVNSNVPPWQQQAK